MNNPIFTGAGVAIVTPFTKDGVDFDKLGELIEYQIANKTDAIVICGTTGECATMPDEEHMAAIKYTVEKTAGRIPVIGGTGTNDTAHCIRLSKYANEVGCDGLLLVTPYYNKTTQKGLYEHYKAVAEQVNIPMILYNVPSRTGLNISIDTLKALAKVKNICAIKEASGNFSYTTEVAAKVPELDLYSGNDDMILPLLALGGKGVISVVSNILPEDTHNICQYFFDGNIEESRKLQLKMLDVINALFCEVNPIPVKTALNLMGWNVGPLRLPLCDMEEKNLQTLKNALTEYGIKLK